MTKKTSYEQVKNDVGSCFTVLMMGAGAFVFFVLLAMILGAAG